MFSFKKVKKRLQFENFWTQEVRLKEFRKRIDYLFPLCKNKSVLHFGCTDFPVFRPNNNLHIQLSSLTKELTGFDIDLDGIELLRQYVDQDYYSNYSALGNRKYDICLIPETIEHVDNIREFLENIGKINAELFVITGPNCFCEEHIERNYYENGVFTEIIHPDHNCWFSPYTLRNAIEKYSGLKVVNIFLLENNTIVCCEAVKRR